MCWSAHLKLLQSAGDERLTGGLFPAESEHVLHGLLKGLPLSNQVSGLHHDEEQVVHLKANPDICNKPIYSKPIDKCTLNLNNLHSPQSVNRFHLGDQFEQPSIPLGPVGVGGGVAGSVFTHEQIGIVLWHLIRLFRAILTRSSIEKLQDERPLIHQGKGYKNLQLLQAWNLNLE